jgi:hypothetical protein
VDELRRLPPAHVAHHLHEPLGRAQVLDEAPGDGGAGRVAAEDELADPRAGAGEHLTGTQVDAGEEGGAGDDRVEQPQGRALGLQPVLQGDDRQLGGGAGAVRERDGPPGPRLQGRDGVLRLHRKDDRVVAGERDVVGPPDGGHGHGGDAAGPGVDEAAVGDGRQGLAAGDEHDVGPGLVQGGGEGAADGARPDDDVAGHAWGVLSGRG